MEHTGNTDGLMSRQEALNLSIPSGVAIVGCGGVGSWVAYFLALSGVKELWLFDHDVISEHNLNRIPLSKATVGMRKADAIEQMIKAIRPDCKVLAMGRFTPEIAETTHMHYYVQWVVAATDTKASRDEVYKYTRNWGLSYIEAAAEGEYGSATGEPGEWSTELENHPGYASVPVWVGPCVLAATIAVNYITHGRRMKDRTIRLGWNEKTGKFESFTKDQEEENEQERQKQQYIGGAISYTGDAGQMRETSLQAERGAIVPGANSRLDEGL